VGVKVWILGAGGLLGKTVRDLCTERGIAHVATGREVDITSENDLSRFADTHYPTHVINCAAYTDVDRAEKEPERAFAVNAEGPALLAMLCAQRDMKLIHVSTDYVFDGKKGEPYEEEDLCSPVNVYGKSKRKGEEAVLSALPTSCIVRTSWLFGTGGKNFLSRLTSLLQQNQQLQIDHEQMNRLTAVLDLAHVLLLLLNHSGIWHMANRGIATRFEVGLSILERFKNQGTPLSCTIAPLTTTEKTGAPRPSYSVLSTKKLETLIPLNHWQEVLA
jgi:dTDP-4-dehydrorhamnose reductase